MPNQAIQTNHNNNGGFHNSSNNAKPTTAAPHGSEREAIDGRRQKDSDNTR